MAIGRLMARRGLQNTVIGRRMRTRASWAVVLRGCDDMQSGVGLMGLWTGLAVATVASVRTIVNCG